MVELTSLISSFEQFLNGSFASNKNDPNDIDMVVFADAAVVDALPAADKARLKLLFSPTSKASHLCDAYFCPTVPSGHPMFNHCRSQRKYWMGEFGFDRHDVPKGIAVVKHTPSASLPTVSSGSAP